jgi:hypothetical protein
MGQKILLFITFSCISLLSQAQKENKAYAITGQVNNKFAWTDIKQIDIATGKVVKTLFESDKTIFKSKALDKSCCCDTCGSTQPYRLWSSRMRPGCQEWKALFCTHAFFRNQFFRPE